MKLPMILHLSMTEYAPGYAIFDPALATALSAHGRSEDAIAEILSENAKGELILFADSDGIRTIAVYVDEEPGDVIRQAAVNRAGDGICRFRSGWICIRGVDAIRGASAEAGIAIPAGAYHAEGFDVDWPTRRTDQALREAVGLPAYALWTIYKSLMSIGCFLIVLLSASLVGGIFHQSLLGRVAVWSALAGLAFIGLASLMRRLPAIRRVRQEVLRVEKLFPRAVLVLRKLPDNADTSQLRGLAFGIDHTRRNRPRGFEVMFRPQAPGA